MDKMLRADDYGICLFSVQALQDFLKTNKVRSRKLLQKFQKDKDLYLAAQKEGIWIPFVQINAYKYTVKVDGYDAPFGEEWDLVMEYEGFNIEVKDGLWIAAISCFHTFDADKYHGTELSYQTYDGKIGYLGYKYDVPAGKYLFAIRGHARRQKLEDENLNYGFSFSLNKVGEFEDFKNPREEEYDFNIGQM